MACQGDLGEEGIPRRSPGSRSLEPDRGIVLYPSETKISVSARKSSRGSMFTMQFPVNAGAPDRRTRLTSTSVGMSESEMFPRAGVSEVVDVVGETVVGNEGGGSVRVVVGKGKIAKGWAAELVGKRSIRALLETHPAVPSQGDRVLHSARRDNAHVSYDEGGCGREA